MTAVVVVVMVVGEVMLAAAMMIMEEVVTMVREVRKRGNEADEKMIKMRNRNAKYK